MEMFIQFVFEEWLLFLGLGLVIFLLFKNENQMSGPTLSPQEAIKIINGEGGVFVDLRNSPEFKDGHIQGAKNIPYSKLSSQISQLEKYRSQTIVLVCKMGSQSGAGCKQLRSEGFDRVAKMKGGMFEWENLSLPIVK